MKRPGLLAIDWGTSRLRAWLVDPAGAILAERDTADGILSVVGGAAGFASVLTAVSGDWRAAQGDLPILMSGMIGARQGWREAPYVDTPADLASLAGDLLAFDADGLGRLRIVPGVATRGPAGTPDVMRGEEVQVFGACTALSLSEATLVLPGTHAKWVEVAGGRIVGFRTFMTGEVFAALKDHTILGRMMAQTSPSTASEIAGPGFARGVAAARDLPAGPGGLLHGIFATRTLALFDALAPGDAEDYLSGLLIGAELLTAAPRDRPAIVVGGAALATRYATAASALGLATITAPAHAGVLGLLAIARSARLLSD